jgi:hypothetical protein
LQKQCKKCDRRTSHFFLPDELIALEGARRAIISR